MNASNTAETIEQPVQTAQVSTSSTYPLLGFALVMTTAAICYGILYYVFMLD
ncbi:hypothetical protein [Massilia aerilata]|uniref:Uncharacterized protein n=1 Tax=Massilia aerilata TaxID=453817 RepID=A0ABW0RWZ5_9BURK